MDYNPEQNVPSPEAPVVPISVRGPEPIQCKPVEVYVDDKGVERASKHLKRKMASEGIPRELKRRRHYMKPSIAKRKKSAEAARRRRKRVRIVVPGPMER